LILDKKLQTSAKEKLTQDTREYKWLLERNTKPNAQGRDASYSNYIYPQE